MTARYPWYEVTEGEELEQGDILIQCPVLSPLFDSSDPRSAVPLAADVLTYDLILMTQSCDIVNDKITDLILCPHWDIEEAGAFDAILAGRGFQREVRSGR